MLDCEINSENLKMLRLSKGIWCLYTVDMKTGRPCVDFLDIPDLWHSDISLSTILITLQVCNFLFMFE